MAEEHHLESARGAISRRTTQQKRDFIFGSPKARRRRQARSGAHGTNLLDDFAEALNDQASALAGRDEGSWACAPEGRANAVLTSAVFGCKANAVFGEFDFPPLSNAPITRSAMSD
jgi:hypothetical protein